MVKKIPNPQEFFHNAINCLGKKHDCKIFAGIIKVIHPNSYNRKHDLGNKSWGFIDGLTNYHGFTLQWVDKF